MNYLENIAEPIKASSFIEPQSAEIYPWKRHIPMKAQIEYDLNETPR